MNITNEKCYYVPAVYFDKDINPPNINVFFLNKYRN